MSNKYALEPGLRAMLVDMGMSPASVLRRAGLRADLLASGTVWLDQDQYFALWRAMEAESSEPNLPLLIEHVFAPGAPAPTVYAAMASPDLNTAASRIATYKKLIGPMRLIVDVSEAATTISYEWPAGANPPATLILSELLFWVELAHDTREQLARHYLARPELSAHDISFLLGYEETSSFYRAFHNWTGQTPERVRAGHG